MKKEADLLEDKLDFSILFAADMEEDIHDIPGAEGSWISVKPMDASAMSQFISVAQNAQHAVSLQDVDIEKLEMILISNTVTDFNFRRTRKTKTGDIVTEDTTSESFHDPSKKKKYIQEIMPKLSYPVFRWIAEKCYLVNGLGAEQEKN